LLQQQHEVAYLVYEADIETRANSDYWASMRLRELSPVFSPDLGNFGHGAADFAGW
jgi:hypothetical protein